MPAKRRILYVVGLDATEAAITWQVTELARAWSAPVVLLGARQRRRWKIGSDRKSEEIARRLSAIAVSMKGYVADIRVTEEPLALAAVRIADEIGAELIAVGAGECAIDQPASALPDALKIAREAHVDVLICKPFADPYVGHVLCAADTTPAAGAAVLRAVELSSRFNALLRIVSVMPEPMWSAADDPEDQVRSQHERQKAFLDQFDLRGVGLSRAVVWSRNAAVEVLDEAQRYGEGLLVIGASSHAPLPSGQLGPNAQAILAECPSSLLIVKKLQPSSRARSGTRAQPASTESIC
ncbi:MAG TPA: universal stress protein [Nevskiaceae bacterium]|nr:universal stress protein [Nevskiaceae bacterium]